MFESPNDALNLLFIILIPMLITAAVTAVFSAISTLAVYYYNKSRSVKEKSATYFLIFLGGILGVIIYYFVTKNKKVQNYINSFNGYSSYRLWCKYICLTNRYV